MEHAVHAPTPPSPSTASRLRRIEGMRALAARVLVLLGAPLLLAVGLIGKLVAGQVNLSMLSYRFLERPPLRYQHSVRVREPAPTGAAGQPGVPAGATEPAT